MIPAYHRKYRAAFKCALTVINLVCITAQFSYKFYFSASFPVMVSSDQTQTKPDGYALPAFGHPASDNKVLSLDKRFYSEIIFALPPQGLGIDRPVYPFTREYAPLSPAFHHAAGTQAEPRGPPFSSI
jgi:hypothetical protein